MSLKTLVQKQRTAYNKIGKIFCPILGEDVYFTSDGFIHLQYKSNRKKRNVNEQFLKLSCFTHAPDVIAKSSKIEEVRQYKKIKYRKVKDCTSYEITHEVNPGKTIRVIIERVGGGNLEFASIMPHNNKSRISPKK